MTEVLMRYRRLERKLWLTRWKRQGDESAEEDDILDAMELAWRDLSESEQAMLRIESPRCWPMDSSAPPPQFADALYVSKPVPWAYEGFSNPLQTILMEEAA